MVKLNGVFSPTNSIKGFIPQIKNKRLAVQYSLSGEHNSNDYTLTIKNINRLEANQFKELIRSINQLIKYRRE